MEKIEAVSITVESGDAPGLSPPACAPASVATGNLIPLLHEIRHALARQLENGETHILDLGAIPMSPDELQRLLELLGEGEVHATLDARGRSDIVETRFPGVWLVTHQNDDDVVIGRFIEVCQVPDILKSQAWDADAALGRLDELLSHAETKV